VGTVIIDSGGANLASLQFAFERLGETAYVTAEAERIRSATRVILPGVGSAGDAMARLRSSGLADVLPTLRQPVLGICLGMQLLFERSEEGDVECLGVVPDAIRRLQPSGGEPVPHMGWNQLSPLRPDPLLDGISSQDYVYFVHSFGAAVSGATLASTEYGGSVSAVVRHENFWGTQFHPERSAAVGARVLANFLKLGGPSRGGLEPDEQGVR
jgi:imidazole glycerol-phosphate synthase subunit HisH